MLKLIDMSELLESDTQTLYAGAAKTDITPPPGTVINGDFVPHTAHTIHDRLYARALALRNDENTIVLIVADICMIPRLLNDEIKAAIAEVTKIPASNILLSATHTHAGGSVEKVYLSPIDEPYRATLAHKILRAVLDALAQLQPAKIAGSKTEIPQHVRCRRYQMHPSYTPISAATDLPEQVKTNPFGLTDLVVKAVAEPDPELCFLAVKSLDDQWIGLFANYGLHYVGDWENGTVTADYFGYFCNNLESRLAPLGNMVAMMSNGTSGDVNIWDFENTGNYPTEPLAKSELIGNELAAAVVKKLSNLEWDARPILQIAYTDLPLAIRQPSEAQIQRAKAILQGKNLNDIVPDSNGLRVIYAREHLLLAEHHPTIPFAIQTLRVGNTVIGSLAAEIFAETGLWLKANAVENMLYFTVGIANGNHGYLPPKNALQKGGYETWLSRTSKLDAEDLVKQTLSNQVMRVCSIANGKKIQ